MIIKVLRFRYFSYLLIGILLLVFRESILHILFFNNNASDISNLSGTNLKFVYLRGMLRLSNLLFEYNFIQSIFFPILILIVNFQYQFLKDRLIKYYIGKNSLYFGQIRHLKLIIAGVSTFIFLIALCFIYLTSIFFSEIQNGMGVNDLTPYFKENSVLQVFAIHGANVYLIYYLFVKSVSIFIESLFVSILIDYFRSYTKAALFYLLFMWGSAPILYSLLPFYLVPMSNLMITSYGGVTLFHLIASYLPFLIVVIYMRINKSYEVV